MTNNTHDEPHMIVLDNDAYSTLRADDGDGGIDVLPIVDAFCQGYAEAILWANAYRYDLCPECGPETEEVHGRAALVEHMVQDDDAQYAYQSPGKWWEGMGIDFTDAIDFLASNIEDLSLIAMQEYVKDENRYLAASLVARTVYARHGHDFALTRNGHGAGFWDRGYGVVGDRLTEAAEAYGEHSVLTDDGPTVTTL